MEKTLYQTIKRSAKGLAVAGLVGLVSGCRGENRPTDFNANGDSLLDVRVGDSIVFINKGNQSYERTRVSDRDGVPFYQTDSGVYTPYGDFVKGSQLIKKETSEKYSFSGFGEKRDESPHSYNGVALGDMDGDGDLDIVKISTGGHIYIFENKIPQKRDSIRTGATRVEIDSLGGKK